MQGEQNSRYLIAVYLFSPTNVPMIHRRFRFGLWMPEAVDYCNQLLLLINVFK